MSSINPETPRNCKRCSSDLVPGTLACPRCHALVHSDQLDQLAREAQEFESRGDYAKARERWLMGLPLLPADSSQAKWIAEHARGLQTTSQNLTSDAPTLRPQAAPPPENKWAKRLGPLGPLAILLAKGKVFIGALFKLKFLFSFFAFFGLYWAIYGWRFGLGFAVLIFIHEMGHYIDIKRRGLPAEMPVFLPGLGAYVRWQALGVSLETRAAVSLAGPLAGLLASIACFVLWQQTGNVLWAALARAGAFLNLLNLIPVWVLDGAGAVVALNKMQRIALLIASLGLWFVLGDNLFLLVAAGATYQAFFVRDAPSQPSAQTIAYFVAVMAALGVMLKYLPAQGIGTP